jgi:hypothetical protein
MVATRRPGLDESSRVWRVMAWIVVLGDPGLGARDEARTLGRARADKLRDRLHFVGEVRVVRDDRRRALHQRQVAPHAVPPVVEVVDVDAFELGDREPADLLGGAVVHAEPARAADDADTGLAEADLAAVDALVTVADDEQIIGPSDSIARISSKPIVGMSCASSTITALYGTDALRLRYPSFPLVLSALGYGPANLTEGFRLARAFQAQGVWCEVVPGERIEYEEDDGSYREAEVISRELALQVQARERPEAMHVAGVHMKYTRPLDGRSFEEAMKAALGSVDGINITGPKTGVLADVERIRRARTAAGEWPLGLASGVSVDNVASVASFVDYLIVGTSLKKDDDALRTDEAKVRALREKLDALGYGTR